MENQESPRNQEGQEFSGKTVDEAIKAALEKLGVGQEEVEITVLKKGKSGILGLGAEEARISVKLLAPAPMDRGDASQVAQEILSKLLQTMGVEATVHIVDPPLASVSPGSKVVALDIRGDDLGILIGRRGQTLMSVQYLMNLLVSHKTKARIPVMVDVEGYKRRRYEALQSLAMRLADQVKSTRRAATLEPMPANERRIIHLALSDHPDVVTQSVGAGEGRKVVIMPRGKESRGSGTRPTGETGARSESRERQTEDDGI